MKKPVEEKMEIRGSGGGSSSGGSTPTEAPNTLRSVVKGRILDMVAYGPIKGLANGLKSVYLDDTQAQNEDGSFNFDGITLTQRYGTPDQDYINGFPTVENSIEVGTEVLFDNPPVRSITNNDADAALITVQLAALVAQDSKGNTGSASVQVLIDLQINNGAWINVVNDTITGKTTSPYPRSYRVNLRPMNIGNGEVSVRVRRGNKESTSSNLQDALSWTLITEIIDARFSYPNIAMVGIEINSQYFGATMPARSYDLLLSIVDVPSNYDPITRQYSGFWDGTFKKDWTDNPAWAYYDLATHPIIGAGLDEVDKWELYRIGQYCDELVPDGYGGLEPRFSINTAFTSQENAVTALNNLAQIFRGMSYWGTNTVVPVADMPTLPVKIIAPSNVLEGEFEYTGTSMSERHSVAVVMWNDPNDAYKAVPEIYEDPDSIQLYGWKETRVTAVGCASRGQAHRLAKWILYSERMETQVVNFRGPLELGTLRPGDIIEIADPDYQGARMAGRLKSATATEVVLDAVPTDTVASIGGQWYLTVAMPDGTSSRVRVSSFSGTTVYLLDALPAIPEPGFIWALSSAGLSLPQYRVVGVTEDSDSSLYTVTATEYDPNKYNIVEFDLDLPSPPTSSIPTGALLAPSNLTFEVYKYQAGGSEHQGITIGWTPPKDVRVTEFILDVMPPNQGGFSTVYRGPGTSFDLQDAMGGRWTIRVRSAAGNLASAWTSRTVQVATLLLPVPPDDVIVTTGTFSITLSPQSAYPEQLWEFWRSLTPLTIEQIESLAVQLPTGLSLVDTSLKPDTQYYYFVRGYNQYGKSTWFPVQAKTENNFDEIMEAVIKDAMEGELGQWINSEVDDGIQTAVDEANAYAKELTERISSDVAAVQETVTYVNGQVNELRSDLDEDVATLTDQIANLEGQVSDLTDAFAYDKDTAYAENDVVRGGKRLYRAIGDVPAAADGSNAPPNAAYWVDIGEVTKTAEGLAARVDTAETSITNINGTLTSQASQLQSVQTELAGKASNTALQSLTSRVDSAEGTLTSQGQAITSVTNNLATTNQNLGALQTSFTSLTGTVSNIGTTVTSQGQAITSINTTLSGIGGNGTNLLPAEYTSFSDVPPTLNKGAGTTLTTEALASAVGGYVMKLTTTTSNVGYFYLANSVADYNIRLKPNVKYLLSFWAQGSAAHDVGIRLRFLNAGGTVTENGLAVQAITTTMTRYSVLLSIPATLVDQATLVIYSQNTAAIGFTVFDGFMLEQQVGNATVASSFTPGYSTRQTNALAAAATTLTGRVTATETGLTSVSQNVTSLNNSLSNLGGENLIYNPSFQKVSSVPQIAEGWRLEVSSGVTATPSLVDSFVAPAEKAQRVDASGLNTSTLYASIVNTVAYATKVVPGQILTVSGYIRGTAGLQYRIYFQFMNSSGVAVSTPSSAISAVTGDVQRPTLSAGVPTGAVTVNVYFRLFAGATLTAGFLEVARPQIEIGAVMSGWKDNNRALTETMAATSTALSSLTSTVSDQGTALTSAGQSITSLNNVISRTGDNNPVKVYQSLFTGLGLDQWAPDGGNPTPGATTSYSKVAGNTSGATLSLDSTQANLESWWGSSSRRVRFDPTRLYKVSARVQQVSKGGKAPATYLGLHAFNEDGVQINVAGAASKTGSHYVLTAGNVLPEGVWTTFTAYVKGFTVGSESGGAGAGTIADPKRMISNTAYISPMALTGHQAQGGVAAIDFFTIEDVTEQTQIDAAASALQTLTSTVSQQGTALTSVSQSITSLSNSLTSSMNDAGGANLLYNASFDRVSPTNSALADGWYVQGSPNSVNTPSLVPSTLAPGGNAQRMDCQALGASVYGEIAILTSRLPKVAPGAVMTLSVSIRGTVGAKYQLWIIPTNSSYVTTGNKGTNGDLTDGWQRVSVTHTIPANTAQVQVYIRCIGGGSATSGFIIADNVQLEMGDTMSGWSDSNGVLVGDVAATSAALQSLTSTVTQQGTAITSTSQSLTSLTNSIGNIGGENLLFNPSFDRGATLADGWLVRAANTATYSPTLVTSGIDPAGKAQRLDVANLTANGSAYCDLAITSDKYPSLGFGQVSTASTFVRGTAGLQVQLYFQFRDSSNVFIANSGPTTVTLDGNWQRISLTSNPAPTNTAKTDLLFRVRGQGTVLSGFVEWDRAQLELGDTMSGWSDNTRMLVADVAATSTAVSSLTSTVINIGGTVTSQGTQLTNLNNTLSGMSGGVNLIAAEYAVFGSVPPTLSKQSTTVVVTTEANANALGKYLLKIAAPSGSVGWFYFAASSLDWSMKLKPNKSYILSFWARSDVAHTMSLRIKYRTASSTTEVQLATAAITTAASMTRYSAVMTMPAALLDDACLVFYSSIEQVACNSWYDGFMLEEQVGSSAIPSTFSVGNTARQYQAASAAIDLIDSRVTSVGGTVTSQGTRLTSLENTVTDTTNGLTTKASTAALNSVTTRVTAAEGTLSSVSTQVTQLKASVDGAPASGVNLIPDQFSWMRSVPAIVEYAGFSVVSAPAVPESPSGYVTAFVTSSATYSQFNLKTAIGTGKDFNIKLTPGTYKISAYISVNNANLRFSPVLLFGNNSGAQTGSQGATTGAKGATGARIRYTWEFVVTAEYMAAVGFTITGASGALIYFDSPMLERMNGSTSGASAYVSGSSSARADLIDGTLTSQASSISSLTSRVGNNESTVSTISSTINGMQGMWGVKVAVSSNGRRYIAGMGVNVTTDGNLTQGEILLQADRLVLLNTSTGGMFSPFFVSNNIVYIATAMIQDASIGTAKIADAAITSAKIGTAEVDTLRIRGNAVTVPVTYKSPDQVAGQGVGNWITLMSVILPMDDAGQVMMQFAARQDYTAGVRNSTFEMMINGLLVASGGGVSTDTFAVLVGSIAAGPGNHTITVRWYGADSTVAVSNKTIFVMGVKR